MEGRKELKCEQDTLVFSTGKEIYANHGIVGINPSLGIFEGYDDDLYPESFTKDEKIELADYMIGLWKKFREE